MAKKVTPAAPRTVVPKKVTKPKSGKVSTKPPGVVVRMYRQGLGDCLLLTFNAEQPGGPRHVMIDFGTLGNHANPQVTLAAVIADIAAVTGGRVDLLVNTHEHQDHLSGFNSQKDAFTGGQVKVDRVWQAWTENPADPDARKLARYKGDLGRALAAALAVPGAAVPEAVDLLGFFGDDHAIGADKFAVTINAAMEFARTGLTEDVTYQQPVAGGAPLTPDWLPGWRVYVLGPPRDRTALGDTGEHGSDALYGIAAAARSADANLQAAAAALPSGNVMASDTEAVENQMPFDVRFRRTSAEAGLWSPDYFADDAGWRRIDSDYFGPISDLALQLDNLTNNTSLALAFERIADGKVLLFPADAQEGNWLSWQKLTWGVDGRTVTVNDLLARTVFYKAGHHSSHNATLREFGLEKMTTHAELVTFIPVDRAIALGRNPKGSWAMPAVPLLRRLLDKCQGRVMRSDLGWAAPPPPGETEKAFVGLASDAEWATWDTNQKTAAHVRATPLCLEFELK